MAFTKNPTTEQGAYALLLRKRAGAYLKGLRNEQKLTQTDLAKRLGLEYYTFISQVETGLVRVPPEQMTKVGRCPQGSRCDTGTRFNAILRSLHLRGIVRQTRDRAQMMRRPFITARCGISSLRFSFSPRTSP
jgi:DNA-binding XRE family transcriptional regulator